MQIDLTPSEAAVMSGVLMAQMHPMLLLLRDRETSELVVSILNKLENALLAETN